MLKVAAPFLDAMLAVGDRLSRAVDRDKLESSEPARAQIATRADA